MLDICIVSNIRPRSYDITNQVMKQIKKKEDKINTKIILEFILREYGFSESHIRKLIPYKYKNHNHVNLRYK